MTGTGMRRTAGKILHSVRGILCLIFAVILTAGTACADVFIDQEKPEDWEDRYLLRIYALRSLDCDAYILECDGERMILDGGKNASYLTEFMEKHGFSYVDMIFNSHPHDDHIDAVYNAILKGRLTADVFYSPFRENYSDASDTFQKRTVRELAAKGITYRQVFNGDELMLGGARITVYRYDGDTKKPNGGSMTINDMSAVLRVRFGNTAILMTADIGAAGSFRGHGDADDSGYRRDDPADACKGLRRGGRPEGGDPDGAASRKERDERGPAESGESEADDHHR